MVSAHAWDGIVFPRLQRGWTGGGLTPEQVQDVFPAYAGMDRCR